MKEHAEMDDSWFARHLAGTLPAAEADAFEQHLLFCGECQERLELEEALRDGVRAWTADQVVRQAAVRAGVLAWLARRARSRGIALAACALFAITVVPVLLLREVSRLRGELVQAQARAQAQAQAQAQPRALAGAQGSAAAAPPTAAVPPAPGTGARQVAGLAEQLAAARQAAERAAVGERHAADERDRLAHELATERSPRIDTPIVTMSPLRTGGGAGEPPAARVPLPAAPGSGAWITLALEVEGAHYATYAVTLARAGGGAPLWHGAGLHLDASDALTLSLPASLLAPGDYEIRAEGLAAGAAPAAVARYVFRAEAGAR